MQLLIVSFFFALLSHFSCMDVSPKLTHRNVTGIQWVASEAWVTASLLTTPHFHPLLEGTLGFSFPGVRIPGLKKFLLSVRPSVKPGMEFVNMFWEELFGCRLKFRGVRSTQNEANAIHSFMGMDVSTFKSESLFSSGSLIRPFVANTSRIKHSEDESVGKYPVCTGSEDLKYTDSSYTDVSQVRISYNVYKAVYAIAHALHALLNCDSTGNNKGICKKDKPITSKEVSSKLQHM